MKEIKVLMFIADKHYKLNEIKSKFVNRFKNNNKLILKSPSNNEKNNSKYYLYYVTFVGLFRTIVYIFFKDSVGKVKVTDVAWNNPITREVIHSLTRLIMMLMFFKASIFAWGTTLEKKKRDSLSIISFIFDIFLIIPLSNNLFIQKDSEEKAIKTKDKAFVHRNPIVPFLIQLSTIIAGIFNFIS